MVCLSLSKELFSDAAEQLLQFFLQHPSTFECSGWVNRALGAISGRGCKLQLPVRPGGETGNFSFDILSQ
jgi:hypothetical protein